VFFTQPSSSFADFLCDQLRGKGDRAHHWSEFEFAVAWVNHAGAKSLDRAVQEFAGRNGAVHATVGLDFGSTTYEGLSCLLDLEASGARVSTHVFCDENRTCTFHPKVFLFSDNENALLLVGSNNMTGGGLETNVEATVGVHGNLDHETIREARNTLAAWRNDKNERSRRLTRELLNQLHERGYVLTEDELRTRRRAESAPRPGILEPLFGRSATRPRRSAQLVSSRTGKTATSKLATTPKVLLMRVRPRRNGKQIQVSLKLLETPFMNGATEVVSASGVRRQVGFNFARGIRNTARFEAPEMHGIENPVARFRWVRDDLPQRASAQILQYEIFDANKDPAGLRIYQQLEAGIGHPPETDLGALSEDITVITTKQKAKAQWYRLES
jgi:hypothetical protein